MSNLKSTIVDVSLPVNAEKVTPSAPISEDVDAYAAQIVADRAQAIEDRCKAEQKEREQIRANRK